MNHSSLWRSSALVLALALTACIRQPDGVDTSPEAIARREADANAVLRLEVVNRSTYSIDLYIPQGGTEFRIGQARPLATTRQEVPQDLVIAGSVIIVGVTSPGGRRISSSRMTVRRGEKIVFEVMQDLRSSRAFVRG